MPRVNARVNARILRVNTRARVRAVGGYTNEEKISVRDRSRQPG